jgi:F420H(2)-dependent quinone reductase
VLTYARDGQDFVVVASMGDAPRAPGWYHNLKSEPQAAINIGTRRIRVTANPTLPGDLNYARLWRIVNENNSNHYQAYQQRTTRPIPVVRLTPV